MVEANWCGIFGEFSTSKASRVRRPLVPLDGPQKMGPQTAFVVCIQVHFSAVDAEYSEAPVHHYETSALYAADRPDASVTVA